ncbi:MAG: hypothetical protein HY754_09935 [Nitrospirae bacterium]|nr:hypothetical protein [Nitrospirota bacterium]
MQVLELENEKTYFGGGVTEDTGQKKLCPFVQDPENDCYIVLLNSLNIEAAIYYCGKNFEECEMYKRRVKTEGNEK